MISLNVKVSLFLISFLSLYGGCVFTPKPTIIKMERVFDPPAANQTKYIPEKSRAKETITEGTEKTVNSEGFIISDSTALGVPAKTIRKAGLEITVAHVPFEYLRNLYGINYLKNHPAIPPKKIVEWLLLQHSPNFPGHCFAIF